MRITLNAGAHHHYSQVCFQTGLKADLRNLQLESCEEKKTFRLTAPSCFVQCRMATCTQ